MAINWNLATQGNVNFADVAQKGLMLGQQISKYNTDKEMEGVVEKLMGYMQDPDFDLMSSSEFPALMAQRPELAERAMKHFDNLSNKRKNEYMDDMQFARDSVNMGQPEVGLERLAKRVAKVVKSGGTPDDSIRAFRLYQDNPEKFSEGVAMMIKARTGADLQKDKQVDLTTGLQYDPNNDTVSVNKDVTARLNEIAAQKAKLGSQFDFKNKREVTNDVTKMVSDASAIYGTAKALDTLRKNPSGAAAVASIYKFMKALDPASTVMQGEISSAENAGGVPEYVRNFYNKLATGENVSTTLLGEFTDTAKRLANSAIETSRETTTGYLNALADDMPASFYTKQLDRLPKMFDIAASTAVTPPAPDPNNPAVVTPIDPSKPEAIEELRARIEKKKAELAARQGG